MNSTETKFSYLPLEITEKILMYASEYSPALKLVCHLWNDLLDDKKEVITIHEIIRRGHSHILRWLHRILINFYEHEHKFTDRKKKLQEAIYIESYLFANMIFEEALIFGQENICRLLKEWGADIFIHHLELAAKYGYKDICQLILEWDTELDGNDFIYEAAFYGHENICHLAIENGLDNYNQFILAAERGGHENIIQLAKEFSVKYDDRKMKFQKKYYKEIY